MKKLILIALILICSLATKAQYEYNNLIGHSYQESIANRNLITVNKPIIIIYDDLVCFICINNVQYTFGVVYNTMYTENGIISERFESEQMVNRERGWITVAIEHKKGSKYKLTITVGDNAYFSENAEPFSADDKISNNVGVMGWQKREKDGARESDSLKAIRLAKAYADSIAEIKFVEHEHFRSDSILQVGNNYNNADLKPIVKSIDSLLNQRNNDGKYIDGRVKVYIDKDGLLTHSEAFPGISPKTISDIDDILNAQKFKVRPFYKNDINYPSYSEFYISVTPNTKSKVKHSAIMGILQTIK
jgi:hypothetical protein